ncbi:hypothetical protein [Streptomyces sp. NPDC003395]
MRTDDILNQIDTALHDYDVSDDAMRSRPEPEPQEYAAPRVWVTTTATDPGSGGWVELGGVLDVTIDQGAIDATAPAPTVTWDDIVEWMARAEAERVRRAGEMLEVLRVAAEAARPAVDSAAAAFAAFAEAARQHPARRRYDRPAWQSPYGPATRRC